MTDELNLDEQSLSPAAFGRAFRAFLEQAVNHQEEEDTPFGRRLAEHLGDDPRGFTIVTEEVSIIERPNVQAAFDAWTYGEGRASELVGISAEQKRYGGIALTDLVALPPGGLLHGMVPKPGPVDYVNVNVGREEVRACVEHGLYLLRGGGEAGEPLAVVVSSTEMRGEPTVRIEVMAPRPEAATEFFAEIRESMRRRSVYRGQVISLGNKHGPFGDGAPGVEFVALPEIRDGEIILPEGVLERVERHTSGFARHADRLLAAGRHLKRGLLLHGPPGTGKTLTAMYLAGGMAGRTTLILSGSSYGLVAPTCELARNLQPSMVILEDVDLVAEERGMEDMGENPLLFELLNEMDGLSEDADVIFMLTTNRPDLLEPALVSRPGRIDQATEIPLPDAGCRRRLISLYGRGLDLRLEDAKSVVSRTEGVSASFIKELLRRATLYAAEEDGDLIVTDRHVKEALDELLVAGGNLTMRLLGGKSQPGSGAAGFGSFGPPGG